MDMVRKKRIPTLWEIPDQLWERIEKLIDDLDPPAPTGCKREDARKILDGLIFRFRTGCQWNHIPRVYGDDSTLHRTFQPWEKRAGVATRWVRIRPIGPKRARNVASSLKGVAGRSRSLSPRPMGLMPNCLMRRLRPS